jgi:hypothetical protein
MPSAAQVHQSNFRKEDFEAGPRVLTIKICQVETFEDRKTGKLDKKLRLRFLEDDRGCVLSKTRTQDTIAVAGSDDYDKWVGVKVELFLDPTIRNPDGKRGGIGIRQPK